MIKVNLLPAHLRPKRELINVRFVGIVITGVTVAVIFGMFLFMQIQIMSTDSAWKLAEAEKAKADFNEFSILVWLIWLIPYISGAVFGASR
jgi:hypothetical protein